VFKTTAEEFSNTNTKPTRFALTLAFNKFIAYLPEGKVIVKTQNEERGKRTLELTVDVTILCLIDFSVLVSIV
jgi:hypothetical protein